ncbi:MAG TPA: hypothetical protein VEI57_14150 [Nitrospirota bacterium]|nr:hypothetical protein [Nitrospirota bacterium]
MFNVDIAAKRVVILHTVEAVDGRVDLMTTFDLCDVPEDKVLLWAATNRLTHWLSSLEMGKLTAAEVKDRFDNLVMEYKGYFQSNAEPISQEEQIIVDNLHKVLREGVSMEELVQSLIHSTSKFSLKNAEGSKDEGSIRANQRKAKG